MLDLIRTTSRHCHGAADFGIGVGPHQPTAKIGTTRCRPEQETEYLHAARSEDPHGPTMHSPVGTNCVILGSHPSEPVGMCIHPPTRLRQISREQNWPEEAECSGCAMSPVKTVKKQVGRFQKGRSGNPSGRPRGSRNVATLACEALLDGQAEALTQKAIQMALAGDPVALRLCLDRIYPARKDRPVAFALPPIDSARDAADLMAAVTRAVANGHITPSEAGEIAKVIDAYVRTYQAAELDERLACAEQLTDAELMRIALGVQETEIVTPVSRLLTIPHDPNE